MTDPDVKVARVLFGEAAREGTLGMSFVMSVIQNRFNTTGQLRKDLGLERADSYEDVAYAHNAFSCINDHNNRNWSISEYFALSLGDVHDQHGHSVASAWMHALALSVGISPVITEALMYTDRSLEHKDPFSNRFYKAVRLPIVIGTPFIPYTMVPR